MSPCIEVDTQKALAHGGGDSRSRRNSWPAHPGYASFGAMHLQ